MLPHFLCVCGWVWVVGWVGVRVLVNMPFEDLDWFTYKQSEDFRLVFTFPQKIVVTFCVERLVLREFKLGLVKIEVRQSGRMKKEQ